MPAARPAASASSTPSVESWSQTAMARRPISAAICTSSVGLCRPSEAVVWQWRSMVFMSDKVTR